MQTGIPFPDWLSPMVFPEGFFFGYTLPLRWYALAYIVGIVIGWRISHMAMKRPALWRAQTPPMTTARLEELLTWIVIGVIAGGRLGYVILYRPAYYASNLIEVPQIWDGGMSFHGGFLGVVLAIFIFARRHAIPLGSAADTVALAAPPAILLGRLANFVNAELWGRPTDLPWGVIFPGQAAQACATATTLCARHPSQLYEAAIEGLFLLILLVWMAFRGGALRRPWLISGTFFVVYGLGRFLVELVRQPDAQFVSPGNPLGLAVQIDGYGLTMGQLLSLPMILVGIAVILWAWRRPVA